MVRSASPVNTASRDKSLTQDQARLRHRRIAAGLQMRDLSEKSGVAVVTICDLENGHQSARVTTLAKLARALNCEIADLMPAEPGTAA